MIHYSPPKGWAVGARTHLCIVRRGRAVGGIKFSPLNVAIFEGDIAATRHAPGSQMRAEVRIGDAVLGKPAKDEGKIVRAAGWETASEADNHIS